MAHINTTPYSSVKIFLDSQFYSTKISQSNMIFNIDQSIITRGQKILMALESASIPLSFYLVDENTNQLIIEDDSVSTGATITIPDGNPNIIELCNQFNEDQYFIDNNYEMTYNSITSKVSLINTDTPNLNFTIKKESDINPLMGFDTEIDQTSDINFTIVGENPVNLSGSSSVYVVVANISNSNLDSSLGGISTGILARIPINQSKNTYLQFQNLTGFRTTLGTHIISSLHVILLDSNRKELILSSNANWSLTIRIDFTDKKQANNDPPLFKAMKEIEDKEKKVKVEEKKVEEEKKEIPAPETVKNI